MIALEFVGADVGGFVLEAIGDTGDHTAGIDQGRAGSGAEILPLGIDELQVLPPVVVSHPLNPGEWIALRVAGDRQGSVIEDFAVGVLLFQ